MKKFIVYKIYYDEGLVYVGRTRQRLENRIRKHVAKEPGVKPIDIDLIRKIEYAYAESEADMFLYEIYYICKFKPAINKDDKPGDDLTLSLPDLEFHEWTDKFLNEWKEELDEKKEKNRKERREKEKLEYEWNAKSFNALSRKREGEITEEEYDEIINKIEKEKAEYRYKNNEIGFDEYCKIMGYNKLR